MTLANKLTIFRIFLIPAFLIAFAIAGIGAAWVCLAIIVLAYVTDALDGWIARKYNQITTFGKFMDPLADKLFVISAFICFVSIGEMPIWVLVIVLFREFIVDGIRMLAASEGKVIPANQWGKWKLFSQILLLISLCVDRICNYGNGMVSLILIYVMLILTVISGWTYLQQNWKMLKFG